MKKISIITVLIMALSLCACNNSSKSAAEQAREKYESAVKTQEALDEAYEKSKKELEDVRNLLDEFSKIQDALNW